MQEAHIKYSWIEYGGGITRKSWIETSGLWTTLHWERQGMNQMIINSDFARV